MEALPVRQAPPHTSISRPVHTTLAPCRPRSGPAGSLRHPLARTGPAPGSVGNPTMGPGPPGPPPVSPDPPVTPAAALPPDPLLVPPSPDAPAPPPAPEASPEPSVPDPPG